MKKIAILLLTGLLLLSCSSDKGDNYLLSDPFSKNLVGVWKQRVTVGYNGWAFKSNGHSKIEGRAGNGEGIWSFDPTTQILSTGVADYGSIIILDYGPDFITFIYMTGKMWTLYRVTDEELPTFSKEIYDWWNSDN